VTSNDFDVAIDLRGDVRHLAWFALAGVPIRLGYGRTGGGFWLTREPRFRAVHEVERNLDLVRQLVPEAQAGPLVPVPIGGDDIAAAHAVLPEAGCDPQGPYVVCHPGAGYASKRWEPESLARALDRLEGLGLGRTVLVGTASDAEMVQAVLRHTQTAPAVAVGRTALRPLAALLQGARLFLGHDSGPSHLAVAMQTPCVLLYSGVNDPTEWGPWQGKVRLLHAPVECSPCGLRDCNRQHECMRGFGPDEVVAAARALTVPEGTLL
jgi:ADP-heptose:LPS heptosyltransferase